MCEPATAFMIGSAAIGATGAIVGGMNSNKAHQANAAALEVQQRQRDQKATFDIDMQSRAAYRQVGHVKAEIGRSGISGASFSDIIADDASEASLQQQGTRYSAGVDNANLQYRADSERAAGESAVIGSYFQAAGSVASAFAPKYGPRGAYGAKGGVSLSSE